MDDEKVVVKSEGVADTGREHRVAPERVGIGREFLPNSAQNAYGIQPPPLGVDDDFADVVQQAAQAALLRLANGARLPDGRRGEEEDEGDGVCAAEGDLCLGREGDGLRVAGYEVAVDRGAVLAEDGEFEGLGGGRVGDARVDARNALVVGDDVGRARAAADSRRGRREVDVGPALEKELCVGAARRMHGVRDEGGRCWGEGGQKGDLRGRHRCGKCGGQEGMSVSEGECSAQRSNWFSGSLCFFPQHARWGTDVDSRDN